MVCVLDLKKKKKALFKKKKRRLITYIFVLTLKEKIPSWYFSFI